MKWFNDLSTTAKLFVCFGFLALLLGVVGFVGLTAASDSNAAVDTAYKRDMHGIDLARRAEVERLRIARSYLQGMLARDEAARSSAYREIDDGERDINQTLGELRNTLVLQESLNRLDEAKKLMGEYVRMTREVLALATKDHDRAMVVVDEARALGRRIEADLDQIATSKNQLGQREEERAAERFARSRDLILVATALAMLIAIASAFFGGRAIANPLKDAVRALERVAAGDLSVRLELDRKDEVGQMAAGLNKSIESMRTALVGVHEISTDVAAAASQLAASAEQISSGAQEQAASLEETAASLEEISSTVKQNADNAQLAAQLASSARDAAERGGNVVGGAVAAMTEITKSSKKIADIITTIDEIAFQTNLLALNAAVEAARAGEQGRGFGVVAAEVRSLAQRTASAAKEIRGLIADSSSKVETGTQQVNDSGETLTEIVRSVKRVTDMVSEIAAASREQNAGVDQVNTAVTQVDQVTQGNASQTEELSSTAASLSEKAGHLEQLVSGFELGITAKKNVKGPATPPRLPASHRVASRPRKAQIHDSGVRAASPMQKAAGSFEEF